jgi:hypothetical protein
MDMQDFYLIDRQLAVYSTRNLLRSREKFAEAFDRGSVAGESGAKPLPITPNGELHPGILYESSTDPNVRYYLPEYRLHREDGRYTSRLKWRGPGDDPNGPLAFLTIDLAAMAPPATGFSLLEIPHQAVARIAYEMPVESKVGRSRTPSPKPWVGEWVNVDPNTRGMTRLEIAPTTGGYTFHGYGKCHPSDCDWGQTPARLQPDGTLAGVYDFGFKKTRITARQAGQQLVADVIDDYTEADGRQDRTSQYTLALSSPPDEDTDEERPVLWLEVGALQPVAGNVRRCRLAISEKEIFDRIYEILTKQKFRARLQIRYFATAGRRTWRHAFIGRWDVALQKSLLEERSVLQTDLVSQSALQSPPAGLAGGMDRVINLPPQASASLSTSQVREIILNPAILIAITPSLPPAAPPPVIDPGDLSTIIVAPPSDFIGVINPILIDVLKDSNFRTRVEGRLGPNNLDINAARVASGTNAESIRTDAFEPHGGSGARPSPVASAAPVALRSVLSQAFAKPVQNILAESDLKVSATGAVRSAIPTQALLNERGEPALLEVAIEGVQWIRPLFFSIETNAYMFDIPEDMRPTKNHILLEVDILSDDGRIVGTMYQDSAFRDQVYCEPQEFRLPRQDSYPYLPALRLTFLDLLTQENSADPNLASHQYRVRISYQLSPYIDPGILQLARQQAPVPNARFTALVPLSSTLTVRIPNENGGELVEIPRTGSEVDFEQGILDEIEVTGTQFERLQLVSGGGLEGAVNAKLLGNQDAQIPVKLSLTQNAGQVFNAQYQSDLGGGKHRVSITNRIENPVAVDQLYRVSLGNGAMARPLSSPGFLVNPGETAALDYQVTPATAEVSDLRPLLSSTIVLTNLKDLWKKLITNTGYVSGTFQIDVSTDPLYFEPLGDGSPQLIGLEVAFGDGAKVTLTKDQSKVEKLNLRIPFLYTLIGDPEALNYEYWVTNLYDNGTQTEGPLCTDMGDLEVKPVGAP